MTAALLASLRELGVQVAVDGDDLRLAGAPAVLTDALIDQVRAAKATLRAELQAEEVAQDDLFLAWRAEPMRAQIRPGPRIPFLVARRDVPDAPGGCLSCGDPRGPGRRYRCGPCVRAAEVVVNEAWETHKGQLKQVGDAAP
jgi:TubC N-terminal docking domain